MLRKIILFVFMLGVTGTIVADNLVINDEITILANNGCGNDRSASISAHINGHYLNVAFLADLGSVTIKILDESYTMLELSYIETPSGYQYYIPLEGRYTLLIALEDGDEYRGDFEVSE